MTSMKSGAARSFWRALLDNASRLIDDAHLLFDTSPARAQSLLVLAEEELGKAVALHDLFGEVWRNGVECELEVSGVLAGSGRSHVAKLIAHHEMVDKASGFWTWSEGRSDPEVVRRREAYEERLRRESKAYADDANTLKQRGFYVDLLDNGMVVTPEGIDTRGFTERHRFVAGIAHDLYRAEALLIANPLPDTWGSELARKMEHYASEDLPGDDD